MNEALVLVTGGTGFVGSHCVASLLRSGYSVRTTVRTLDKAAKVRAAMQRAGIDAGDRLTFAAADLMQDAGWDDAVRGCTYVLHVASPLPVGHPKDENEVIAPAREGTLRVLRAARDAGVKRVVLTSSFAAIGYGHDHMTRPFTESDWTDPRAKGLSAYVKSKAIAERAAWDFIEREGGALELTAMNPVAIFGPLLNEEVSSSINMISMQLAGKIPFAPQISFGTVDVRDVAELHVQAMTNPAAAGERFLLVSGESISMLEMAKMLRAHMGAAGGEGAKTQYAELGDASVRHPPAGGKSGFVRAGEGEADVEREGAAGVRVDAADE